LILNRKNSSNPQDSISTIQTNANCHHYFRHIDSIVGGDKYHSTGCPWEVYKYSSK